MSSADDLPPPDQLGAQSRGIADLPPPDMLTAPAPAAPGGSNIMASKEEMTDFVNTERKRPLLERFVSPHSPPGEGQNPFLQGMAPPTAMGAKIGSYALGRIAGSAAMGAVDSAMDGKDGESFEDKIDRAESGGKLSGGIQAAAESLPVVGGALGWGARKVGQALSGVDGKLIANYAKRTDQVNDIIKQSGGDVSAMADKVRSELSSGIQKTKTALNTQISAALDLIHDPADIPAKPILDELEAAKSKLNPNYKASAISDIDEMMNNVKAQAGDGGMLTRRGLYETKQYLNDASKTAYLKGGQVFSRAGEAAKAARDAADVARDGVKQYTPQIAQADAQLSQMHRIEGRLNKNLLAPGTPDGALLAAGSGANPRNAANLRTLENISGVPAAQRANDLATAKAFASPDLLSGHFTGRAMMGATLGGALGGAREGKEGVGPGALLGAAASSPMALKGMINAANIASKVGSKVGIPQLAQAIRQNPYVAQTAAQVAAGQIRRANTDNPMLRGTPDQAPPTLMQNDQGSNRAPAKGPDAWAQAGLSNLGIEDQALSARLLADPKAKQLLIQASDLSPGSKAMKQIMDQIKARYPK